MGERTCGDGCNHNSSTHHDEAELIVGEVLEHEGAGEGEAALQALVLVEQHLPDLILVPAHDHADVIPRVVVHLQECSQRLGAVGFLV